MAVGPHGSVTPGATLRKLGVDAVVRGECEDVIVQLADTDDWSRVASIAIAQDGAIRIQGPPAATPFVDTAAVSWPDEWIARHAHHHHRFDEHRQGFGAEVEASRGCPYNCSFCAKNDYRDAYRRRDLPLVLQEIDRLIAQGVGYIYFIDEIFLPQRALLEALVDRKVKFGVQTRIDLWKPDLLALLGRAGCVSIEAGIESLTVEGREALAKRCRLQTEDLAELLFIARRHVPFVQANLIGMEQDSQALVDVLARPSHCRRSLGERAGAALPLSKLARLPRAVGRARRRGMGARARALSDFFRRVQRHPGRQAVYRSRNWRRNARPTLTRPRRVLMTLDAVGGVWRYSIDLARALEREGVECVLVGCGPEPTDTQRRECDALDSATLLWTRLPLDWMVQEASRIGRTRRRVAAPRTRHRRGPAASEPSLAGGRHARTTFRSLLPPIPVSRRGGRR